MDDAETEDVGSLKCAKQFPCRRRVQFYQGCVLCLFF